MRWSPDTGFPKEENQDSSFCPPAFDDPSLQQTLVELRLCAIVQGIKESKVNMTVSALKECNRFVEDIGKQK